MKLKKKNAKLNNNIFFGNYPLVSANILIDRFCQRLFPPVYSLGMIPVSAYLLW